MTDLDKHLAEREETEEAVFIAVGLAEHMAVQGASCSVTECLPHAAAWGITNSRQVRGLATALEGLLDEADPHWDEWTDVDERHLSDTPVGVARAVLESLVKGE